MHIDLCLIYYVLCSILTAHTRILPYSSLIFSKFLALVVYSWTKKLLCLPL